jgi:hypothetical protein
MSVVTTVTGSKYRLGSSFKKDGIKQKPLPAGISFNFFSNTKAQDTIPVLSRWKQNSDGTVTGSVSNSVDFESGTLITTSPIKKGAKKGEVVTTLGGSKYRLQ